MNKRYIKTNWVDGKTAVNSTRMNNIENAIEELYLEAITPSQIKTGSGLRADITNDGSIQISFQSPVIQSNTVEGVEVLTSDIENKRDGILYFVLVDGKIDKIYQGSNLIYDFNPPIPEPEPEPEEPEPEEPEPIDPEPEPEPEEPDVPVPNIEELVARYQELVTTINNTINVLDQDYIINNPFAYRALNEAITEVIEPNKDIITPDNEFLTVDSYEFVEDKIAQLEKYISVSNKFEQEIRDIETERFMIKFDLIPRFRSLMGTEEEVNQRIEEDTIGNVIEGYHRIDGIIVALTNYYNGYKVSYTEEGEEIHTEIETLEELKQLIGEKVAEFNAAYRLINSYIESVKFRFKEVIKTGELLYKTISDHYANYEEDGIVLASNLTDALEIARTALETATNSEDLEIARETLLNSIEDIESRFKDEIFHEDEYYVTVYENFRDKLDYAKNTLINSLTHSDLIEELNQAIEVGEADFEKRDLTKTGEVVEYEQVGVHYLEFKRLFNKFSKSIKDIEDKEILLNQHKEIIDTKLEVYRKLEQAAGLANAVDHKPALEIFLNEIREYSKAYRDRETPLEDIIDEETEEVIKLGIRTINANLTELITRINYELVAERNQDIIKYRSKLRKLIETATEIIDKTEPFDDEVLTKLRSLAETINSTTRVWSTSVDLVEINSNIDLIKTVLTTDWGIEFEEDNTNIDPQQDPGPDPTTDPDPVDPDPDPSTTDPQDPTDPSDPDNPQDPDNGDPVIDDIIVDDGTNNNNNG